MMALIVNRTKFVGTTTVASKDFIALFKNLKRTSNKISKRKSMCHKYEKLCVSDSRTFN